ncbi:acyltransferase family protein [Stutzerimonas stutzeri]|uniref:acyltransferase family protein n=1 Tax=Stutzerimonas stutzeri TaxID=316 RepID=UPI001F0EBCB4|nr:acyltransferase family protein [Stutzerimonas stutzeri]
MLPLAWGGLWLQRRRGNAGLLVASLLVLAAQQALWPYWVTPENSPDTRWYLPAFLFGTLAALLLPSARLLPRAQLATPFALLTLLLLILALPGTRLWLFDTPLSADLMDKHPYLGLLWAAFLLFLIDGHGAFGRLLCNRPFALLGAISYSTYLIHWLILSELAARWPNNPLALGVSIVFSVAAGAAGYLLAERPLERFRRHLMRTRLAKSNPRSTRGQI